MIGRWAQSIMRRIRRELAGVYTRGLGKEAGPHNVSRPGSARIAFYKVFHRPTQKNPKQVAPTAVAREMGCGR